MSSSDERLRRALTRLPSVQRGQIVVNGVEARTASARVGVQTASMVPARKPVLSAAGNWTLPKVTKTERSSWIRELAAAHALLAAKEIVVGVPGVLTVSIDVADADKEYAVVLRATLTQAALRTARWELGAWQLLTHLDPQYEANLHGRTGELLQLPGE